MSARPPAPRDAAQQARDAAQQASDAELLRQHTAGDTEAFGELVARHQDRLWAVAMRTTGDREVAADCVQEAFIAAFRGAAGYRGEAAVTTWLHRITVNACLDRLRRDQRLRVVGDGFAGADEVTDPLDRHARSETALDVHAALAALPDPQRAALVLVDLHGMSVAEAASILDIPEGTVKSRCSRGREALARLLRLEPSREPRGAP